MAFKLEHANISVSDIDGMIKFLQTAFPEFKIRGEGKIAKVGSRWLHVGTDDTYIALQEALSDAPEKRKPYTPTPGVNHLAYEVDDVDSLRERLISGGYSESTVPNSHPHRKRIYFYDPEGNDWEFIQYFSDIMSERNDYELKDK